MLNNKVYVLGYRDKCPDGYTVINTTSKSKNWSRGLSPFFVGGNIPLYGNFRAKNVENAWQFSKLYSCHADDNGNPTKEYYNWAIKGWNDNFAHRYPMNKGSVPLCAIWGNKKLNYIDSRRHIYIPIYAREVIKTDAFKILKELYESGKKIALLDFDGYNYWDLGYSMKDVVNNPNKKMGHAFVLVMLLEGIIYFEDNKLRYNNTLGELKKNL